MLWYLYFLLNNLCWLFGLLCNISRSLYIQLHVLSFQQLFKRSGCFKGFRQIKLLTKAWPDTWDRNHSSSALHSCHLSADSGPSVSSWCSYHCQQKKKKWTYFWFWSSVTYCSSRFFDPLSIYLRAGWTDLVFSGLMIFLLSMIIFTCSFKCGH